MRTVFLCTQTASPVGGVPNWLEQLDRALPALGWRIVVGLAWGYIHHDPRAFLKHHPLSHTVLLDARTGTAAGRRRALRRAIRAVKPDVVVPTTLFDPFPVVAAMRRGPGPRVLYAAHELSPAMMRDVWCYRGVIDQAVGVSRLLAELLVRVGRLPAERVQRVPYGVRIPAEPNPPRSVDAPLRLGYVGRLDPAKRPLDLVALCDELDRVSLPYHLTILGRGELAAPLRERLAARIQRGTVTLRDPVPLDELYRTIYPALDCTLLFSRDAEGLPIAPMEAMAHGVLLATSDFRGRAIEGLIRHRRTALVFPVGDLRSAALELECVATRPDEWRRISLGGRHAVAQEYSFARMIERWAQVLDETVQRPPAAGPAPGAPIQPVGRLDRWLGVTMAETVRRLLRRRFVHPDPSEWPYCGEEGTEGVAATAAAMASVEQALLRDLAETGLAAPGSGENACPRCVRY